MAFVRGRCPVRDQVTLELVVGEGEVRADIVPPSTLPASIFLRQVPLREAVVIAAELSRDAGCDVVVVDRYGYWPADEPLPR